MPSAKTLRVPVGGYDLLSGVGNAQSPQTSLPYKGGTPAITPLLRDVSDPFNRSSD